MAVASTLLLGGPLRAGLGLLILGVAGICLWVATGIELGIAWTLAIPAAVAVIPAWALLQRRQLTRQDETLTITEGWLWRRVLILPLAGSEIELVPTAGLTAVVLHHGVRAWPVALWVRASTAARIATFLDAAPGGPRPRRLSALPANDR
jgi:hypothetical protein